MTDPAPVHQLATAAESITHQMRTRFQIAISALTVAVIALAVVVTIALREIQSSRIQACMDQNHRHNATIAYIVHIVDKADKHASKAKREQYALALSEDRLLIQDLAPLQNCNANIK